MNFIPEPDGGSGIGGISSSSRGVWGAEGGEVGLLFDESEFQFHRRHISAIKVQFFKLQKPTVSKQYCQILFEKGVRS